MNVKGNCDGTGSNTGDSTQDILFKKNSKAAYPFPDVAETFPDKQREIILSSQKLHCPMVTRVY